MKHYNSVAINIPLVTDGGTCFSLDENSANYALEEEALLRPMQRVWSVVPPKRSKKKNIA